MIQKIINILLSLLPKKTTPTTPLTPLPSKEIKPLPIPAPKLPHIPQDLFDEPQTNGHPAPKKELSIDEILKFSQKYGLELATVQAVIEVESGGSGFFTDPDTGRLTKPKILFEGHVFWKQLKKHGINPTTLTRSNILYPRWDRGNYFGGIREYERLNKAKKIHEQAALESASWGLFQIMGYHWESLAYPSVFKFVKLMETSEFHQLEAFGRFLKVNGLIPALKAKNWALFAKRYNGPLFYKNKYDAKLAKAYKKYSDNV